MGYRKYNVNDFYFEDLSLEGPAYWLGVITADGYLNKNHIELTVSQKDINWVRQFKKAVDAENPIHNRRSIKCVTLAFRSSQISETLHSYGLHKNKSMTVRFCQNVPPVSLRHYIRGLMDGDGYIGLLKKGVSISFAGNTFILSGIKNVIDEISGCSPQISDKRSDLTYGGIISINKILTWLYEGCNFCLKRKQQRAKSILQYYKHIWNPAIKYNITQEQILKIYSEKKRWGIVSEMLGIPIRTLYDMRKRFTMSKEFD